MVMGRRMTSGGRGQEASGGRGQEERTTTREEMTDDKEGDG